MLPTGRLPDRSAHISTLLDVTPKGGTSPLAPPSALGMARRRGKITWEQYRAQFTASMRALWKHNWQPFLVTGCSCTTSPARSPRTPRGAWGGPGSQQRASSRWQPGGRRTPVRPR